MENKKNMFGEARFVFQHAKERSPTVSGRPEGKRVDIQDKFISLFTKGRLNILKESLKVSGIEFKNETFKVNFPLKNEKSAIAELSDRIGELLGKGSNKGKFEKLKKMGAVGSFFEEKDLKKITAVVYAKDFLDKAKVAFEKEFPRFEKFVAEKKIKDPNVECNIVHDATGKYKFKFSTGLEIANERMKKIYKEYNEWAKKNVKTTDKGKSVSKELTKGGVDKAEFDRFAKSPLGRIFGMIGGKKWLELMKEGKAPLAFFIAGLFGYKIGAEAYGGVVDMLPAKYRDKVNDLQKRARGSRFSAKAYAKKRPRSAVVAGAKVMDSVESFEAAIKQMPKKGMKLGIDYKLKKGERLKVDLSGGGKVVLPKGQKAYVNGSLSDLGQTFEKTKIEFTGTIPKGTVFTGKIDFNKVAPPKKV